MKRIQFFAVFIFGYLLLVACSSPSGNLPDPPDYRVEFGQIEGPILPAEQVALAEDNLVLMSSSHRDLAFPERIWAEVDEQGRVIAWIREILGDDSQAMADIMEDVLAGQQIEYERLSDTSIKVPHLGENLLAELQTTGWPLEEVEFQALIEGVIDAYYHLYADSGSELISIDVKWDAIYRLPDGTFVVGDLNLWIHISDAQAVDPTLIDGKAIKADIVSQLQDNWGEIIVDIDEIDFAFGRVQGDEVDLAYNPDDLIDTMSFPFEVGGGVLEPALEVVPLEALLPAEEIAVLAAFQTQMPALASGETAGLLEMGAMPLSAASEMRIIPVVAIEEAALVASDGAWIMILESSPGTYHVLASDRVSFMTLVKTFGKNSGIQTITTFNTLGEYVVFEVPANISTTWFGIRIHISYLDNVSGIPVNAILGRVAKSVPAALFVWETYRIGAAINEYSLQDDHMDVWGDGSPMADFPVDVDSALRLGWIETFVQTKWGISLENLQTGCNGSGALDMCQTLLSSGAEYPIFLYGGLGGKTHERDHSAGGFYGPPGDRVMAEWTYSVLEGDFKLSLYGEPVLPGSSGDYVSYTENDYGVWGIFYHFENQTKFCEGLCIWQEPGGKELLFSTGEIREVDMCSGSPEHCWDGAIGSSLAQSEAIETLCSADIENCSYDVEPWKLTPGGVLWTLALIPLILFFRFVVPRIFG